MSGPHLALLQYPVEPDAGVAGFADRLDRLVSSAVTEGGEFIVLPEYAAVTAASAHGPDLADELAMMRASADALLAAMRDVARRHRIWLLGGTLPMGSPTRNRAPLIAPDGRIAFQDKRVMTRFENELWRISPGLWPCVFATDWGLVGISICYDVEFPALVRAQVEAGAWLILAPSCTDTLHGFHRVRLAARARALENQCYVAIAPTIGFCEKLATLDENHGYAALYGPVDRGFPPDGVLALGQMDAPICVHVQPDRDRLDAVRRNGAVRNHTDWPGTPPPCPTVTPA